MTFPNQDLKILLIFFNFLWKQLFSIKCQERAILLASTYMNHFLKNYRCVKSVRIRSYSGPHFPVFSPNVGKYGPE